jgi:kinesin motor protein
MNPLSKPTQNQTSLFQVYLRLRPTQKEGNTPSADRYLKVEDTPAAERNHDVKVAVGRPTHIILQPPNDSRKRAVEKFAFTKVFEEDAQQLDVFEGTEISSLINDVLCEGRDGLVATLGVTGSGKVSMSGVHNGREMRLHDNVESHHAGVQDTAWNDTNGP